eukprot:2015465-Pleurochrysis_carterae.AAC.3
MIGRAHGCRGERLLHALRSGYIADNVKRDVTDLGVAARAVFDASAIACSLLGTCLSETDMSMKVGQQGSWAYPGQGGGRPQSEESIEKAHNRHMEKSRRKDHEIHSKDKRGKRMQGKRESEHIRQKSRDREKLVRKLQQERRRRQSIGQLCVRAGGGEGWSDAVSLCIESRAAGLGMVHA